MVSHEGLKRESGESSERSRRCKRELFILCHWGNLRRFGEQGT